MKYLWILSLLLMTSCSLEFVECPTESDLTYFDQIHGCNKLAQDRALSEDRSVQAETQYDSAEKQLLCTLKDVLGNTLEMYVIDRLGNIR